MNARSESTDTDARVRELQMQVEDLKELVNTLLSVICEDQMESQAEQLHLMGNQK